MPDPITGASPLLDPSPARPSGPGPTPPAGSTPATPQQELADLKANGDFVREYLAGKPEAVAKMRAAIEKVHAPNGVVVVNGNPQALNARAVDSLATFADLSPDVQAQMHDGRPVSEFEYTAAVRRRSQLLNDQNWRERYMAGDRDARRELVLVNVILGSKLALEKRAR
jgi:hypothetical protein